MIVLGIKEFWDNITDGIAALKDVVFAFIDIVGLFFAFIPEPFNKILGIALVITVAYTAVKIVRMVV